MKVKVTKLLSTFKGENANVTSAFAVKFTRTAILNPRPRERNGNISEIISQPMGPKDNCKTIIHKFLPNVQKYNALDTCLKEKQPKVYKTSILIIAYSHSTKKKSMELIIANFELDSSTR